MDNDKAAALWATAHSDAGRPDPAVELAELEAAVYSRAGSAESAVDFVDPATGFTVRATPSELRLRVLRARLAEQSERAERADSTAGGAERFARLPDPDSLVVAVPALPLAPTNGTRRRLVLPLVAVVAFAAGTVVVVDPPSTPAPAPQPPSATLAPPTTPDGNVLGRWTSAGGDFQASLDAHGAEGLHIALDCVGEGTVTLDLNDAGFFQFNCTSGSVKSFRPDLDGPDEAFEVTVFSPDSVTWGLTIASTPVSEPGQG